jgi:phage shock protein A
MGILDRVSTILKSNINAMLDSAEDPEKMIDQIIRDQAEGLSQLRGQVAETIAEEKRLRASADSNRQLAKEWGQKAELAVRKSADDLAREALHRQVDYEDNARVYEQQWTAQKDIVDKMKAQLHALEEKYEETRRNRDMLLARYQRAKTQQQISKVAATVSTMDPTADLKRMEERISRQEALAAAQQEMAGETLDSRFQALESADPELENRLQALKEKVSAGELPAPRQEGEEQS